MEMGENLQGTLRRRLLGSDKRLPRLLARSTNLLLPRLDHQPFQPAIRVLQAIRLFPIALHTQQLAARTGTSPSFLPTPIRVHLKLQRWTAMDGRTGMHGMVYDVSQIHTTLAQAIIAQHILGTLQRGREKPRK